MQKAIIADISSITKDNNIFGHYGYVAKMYCNILNEALDISIAGGPIYSEQIGDYPVLKLPFDCSYDDMRLARKRIALKLRTLINGIKLFLGRKDTIFICQPFSFSMWMLSILFSNKSNKIYLIEYKDELSESGLNRILYRMVSKKISGVICSNDDVGKRFRKSYILMSDYVYDKAEMPAFNDNCEYDFAVLGIMSPSKDVMDVIRTFVDTDYRILIAGFCGTRYESFMKEKTDNITIINKYLSDEEYDDAFQKSECIILPYNDAYKSQSSGVIYDIIFRGKPVVTKDFDTFSFVSDFGMGVLYERHLDELDFDAILKMTKSKSYYNNICEYLKRNKKQAQAIREFIGK